MSSPAAALAIPKATWNRKVILFVDNRTEYFLSHRLPVAIAARNAGLDVHVTTLTAGNPDSIRELGFTYHEIAKSRRDGKVTTEFGLLGRLAGLYQRLKPDLVHHITLRSVLYGGLISCLTRQPPALNSITGLGYLFVDNSPFTRIARSVLGTSFKIILGREKQYTSFQNIDDKRLFENSGWVKSGKTMLIRGSGVDPEGFNDCPAGDGAPVVVFASRLLRHKGIYEFVEAARLLKDRGTNARFVIVGAPDADNPAGIRMSEIVGWQDSGVVEYWGHQRDIGAVFARAHIVCLPSYREGLPRVLVEAALCGRPIVTTDVAGCREVVSHGENGFLVQIGGTEELAQTLLTLINDRELRDRMGRKGREKAVREFATEHVVTATLHAYRQLLGN